MGNETNGKRMSLCENTHLHSLIRVFAVCLQKHWVLKNISMSSKSPYHSTPDKVFLFNNTLSIFQPAHDKSNNNTCATSEDSDQTAHPISLRWLQVPSTAVRLSKEGCTRTLNILGGCKLSLWLNRVFPGNTGLIVGHSTLQAPF